MVNFEITDVGFQRFQRFLKEAAGIYLSPEKKALVVGRLTKRLRHYNLSNFSEYFRLVMQGDCADERQLMLDLLTTNETYFFRESRHFQFLEQVLAKRPPGSGDFRIWSAACSTGEEPYSIAMTLSAKLGPQRWDIIATDINATVLETAQQGMYAAEAVEKIPAAYRSKYVLKGVRSQVGTILISPALRQKVSFRSINLNGAWAGMGAFDVVFLRNVMIYFDADTKRQLVARIAKQINPGGYLFIGHSESLHGISDVLKPVCPAVYKKS